MKFIPPEVSDLAPVFQQYDKVSKSHIVDATGRKYEPRCYFQEYVFATDQELSFPDTTAWRNGEQFPVVITHITAAMRGNRNRSDEQYPQQGSPWLINDYSMRIESHDTAYMSSSYLPLPTWHNVRNAASDVFGASTSSWIFDKPMILGNRSSFKVQVRLERPPIDFEGGATSRSCSVKFDAIGVNTGRPYTLGDALTLDSDSTGTFKSSRLQNVVGEPLRVIGCAFSLGSEAPGFMADITQLRCRISVDGTGTSQSWTYGGGQPPFPHEYVPVSLLGITSGICVCHRVPGNGWIWEPGQGVDPTVKYDQLATRPRETEEAVMIGFIGYTVIT